MLSVLVGSVMTSTVVPSSAASTSSAPA